MWSVAIVGIAVGHYVLRDGIYIGGDHGARHCSLGQLTDDCNLIGCFRDVVWDQELVMIWRGVVCATTESLLEVGQLHFR